MALELLHISCSIEVEILQEGMKSGNGDMVVFIEGSVLVVLAAFGAERVARVFIFEQAVVQS